ncbi:N-formylglutamate amidohydrolase [Roseobacter sp. HKCCA0434]|uniref:N-formylglutamate amidohydrolase n=1 Tax=Roseobacter sp. HKCCA0434 TaxID=3079297 RepID=UPI002905E16B|nr:N-formylglutamate amidohydrolase [Roseobacter sp. HKCCA0434]
MPHESYEFVTGAPDTRLLLTCDHASNRVPAEIGAIGLSDADMARHIAWDIGARGVTLGLAERLGGAAVLSTVSRIVIDPNRAEDDPTLVRRIYDRSVVEGNRHAGPAEVARRIEAYYRPYHERIERAIAELSARGVPVVIAIHSYTPQLKGRAPRPWEVGILWDRIDGRIAVPLMEGLRADGLCVGDNEPYPGFYGGDSQHRHAMVKGLPNVLIEIRNDLIADAEGQEAWAERLARHLRPILETPAVQRLFDGVGGQD